MLRPSGVLRPSTRSTQRGPGTRAAAIPDGSQPDGTRQRSGQRNESAARVAARVQPDWDSMTIPIDKFPFPDPDCRQGRTIPTRSLLRELVFPRRTPQPLLSRSPLSRFSAPDWSTFTCEFLVIRILPEQHEQMWVELTRLGDVAEEALRTATHPSVPQVLESVFSTLAQ